jgi:hypothetical protein
MRGGTSVKETPRRRITVTSSLNEISMDQLGKRVAVRRGGIIPPAPIPFLTAGFRNPDRYTKTT